MSVQSSERQQSSLAADSHRTVPARSSTGDSSLGVEVRIDRVSRNYGRVQAVSDVSLTVAAGEFVSLLGPSGSGKTTLLMMLAGFEEPDAGTIAIAGRDVTHVAPNKRDIAMVFQRYALFPHMTVAENIAFPLRMRGISRAEQQTLVARALDMVQLAGYGDRRPSALSGGQQQRVALARAIVFDPPVILMDEPLGALDKKLRQHMQIELKQLQRRLGATVIYVTHDQEEALTMSDRVAVMSQGELSQLGAPRELYDDPANPFVADFLGEMNFLRATVDDVADGLCRASAPSLSALARLPAGQLPPRKGEAVRIAVRPEAVSLHAGETGFEPGAPRLAATIGHTVFNGSSLHFHLDIDGGGQLVAALNPALAPDFAAGQRVVATWRSAAAIAYPGVA
ncbi:MAG: ABC transporter ATP-binding protein [Hyphomicrobiales bacterium]|nr:MAG: ABC transporter ATP-binding protein [Hyphomicrobiales bacterium]